MFYSIRHVTRFRYSHPVRESVMELRMQPRSEGPQTLRNFQIVTNPRAQLYAYTDHFGNAVYYFNVLREHSELRIEAQSVIETLSAINANHIPIVTVLNKIDRFDDPSEGQQIAAGFSGPIAAISAVSFLDVFTAQTMAAIATTAITMATAVTPPTTE